MNILAMLFAFLILTGAALLSVSLLKYSIGEGIALSEAFVIFLLYLSGKYVNANLGLVLFVMISLFGYVYFGVRCVRQKSMHVADLYPVYAAVLLFLFIAGMLLLNGDHIQHIDELHQWAAAVKNMLSNDRLPTAMDFTDPGQMRGTTVFYYYFQKFTGYDEGMMYASANLLVWTGFLLPFTRAKKSDLGRICIYCLLVVLIVITLYQYSFKNLLVDLPLAAWSSGVMGWWMIRDSRRRYPNLLLLVSGLILISIMKNIIGILMAMSLILLALLYHLIKERERLTDKTILRLFFGVTMSLGVFALLFVKVLIDYAQNNPELLPEYLRNLIAVTGFSTDKITDTLTAYLTFLWGGNLGVGQSGMRISFVMVFFIFAVLIYFYGQLCKKRFEGILVIQYGFFISVLYLLALFCAYLFMFTKLESVNLISVQRYIGILAIYLIMIPVCLLTEQMRFKGNLIPEAIMLCFMVFLCLGINENFISNNTAIDKENVFGYGELTETKKEIVQIQKLIDADDRVFLINQDGYPGGGEYALSSSAYYLERQGSSYLTEPWKFFPEGCYIHNSIPEGIFINNLPELLKNGGYTYLWIFASDDYLSATLPHVFEGFDETIADGQLYKVQYTKKGEVAGLSLKKLLHTSDPRWDK